MHIAPAASLPPNRGNSLRARTRSRNFISGLSKAIGRLCPHCVGPFLSLSKGTMGNIRTAFGTKSYCSICAVKFARAQCSLEQCLYFPPEADEDMGLHRLAPSIPSDFVIFFYN